MRTIAVFVVLAFSLFAATAWASPLIRPEDADFVRRQCREEMADPTTGLDATALRKELAALVPVWTNRASWAETKALIFSNLCERTAIDVNPHHWFPTFAYWTRHTYAIHPVLPFVTARRDAVLEAADPGHSDGWPIYCAYPDYDHSAPDWDDAIKVGFPGMAARLAAKDRGEEFYAVRRIAAEAIGRLLARLAAQAERRLKETPSPRLKKELASIRRLSRGAPETAYDVLNFIWLYWAISEKFESIQVRSLGNLDRLLTPYYRADLAAGRTTEDEFREQLAYFWWLWGSVNNYWGQPVYFGGTQADGTTEYNEVSKLLFDVIDELALPTPKVLLKIGHSTPDWVWTRTLDMARRMRPLTFVGEESQARVIRSMGYSAEQARTFMLWGCYEWAIRDSANDTFGAAVNLPKQLELLLAEAATNEAFAAADFAAFKRIYFGRVTDVVRKAMAAAAVNERHLAEINPSLLFSLATPYSMETGRDAYCGGMRYGNNTGIWLTGFATTVDALMAVKELVYGEGEKVEKVGGGGEGKRMSLKELGEMMARNWEGHEDLRLKMARSRHKWGNNDQEANALGAEFVKAVTPVINGVPNARGGVYKAVGHAARFFYDFGRWTGATPDGRKAGEELSKNFSPVMGADTEGPTALVNTHAVLDARDLPGDFPLDVALLPATVAGEKGLVVMRSLVEQNFANGGMVIQFNVHDAETLREAQAHPEKYENLQVRVAGWNVRWNDIPREEQDKFILRAESIAER